MHGYGHFHLSSLRLATGYHAHEDRPQKPLNDFVASVPTRQDGVPPRPDIIVQDAKKFFNKTLEINPSHLDAYNSLGIVYAELGDLNQALFNVKKVLELNSNFVSAHNNLGLIYKKFEHFNEAETSFKKAIEIDFKFIESHYNLMELYEKGNQNDKLESIVNNFEKL